MSRYACLSDLNNYFKKAELLGGLTEPEKIQLRINIGVTNYTGEGSQSSPLLVTYNEFRTLMLNNSLLTGARYQITDFQTIYSSNIENGGLLISWGLVSNPSTVYNLIVTALNNNTIDPRVVIVGKSWIVEYNPEHETLPDGVKTKGKITYLRDNNGNSAFYDFKNIKFRRYNSVLGISGGSSYYDLYTFSDIQNNVVIDNSGIVTTKFNELKKDCWNNVFLGDTYNNIFEANCKNNTFIRGCHNNHIKWSSTDNVFQESVRYTVGSLNSKIFPIGETVLSTTISKTIHKVNEATIISFLDPITYAYQVIEI